MFVRASECTVSISQQVRDTKKWGFFILHVSRIKVFLEIHIDFQKCTKHHIFIPFLNNPYVSFWLQKVNITLENKITSGSLYMCTLAYTNMNFFIWHWLPLGAFWGQLFWRRISHAPSENSYFMRVSLDFFFPVQQMSCVVTPTHESQVSSAPTCKKSLHSQILLLSLHAWGRLTLQDC